MKCDFFKNSLIVKTGAMQFFFIGKKKKDEVVSIVIQLRPIKNLPNNVKFVEVY